MDFVEACLDEIALEGLDGITLSSLWIRLDSRKPSFPLSLDDSTKEFLWSSCMKYHESVEFFELLFPRPPLVLYDRFKHTDPETGAVLQMETYPENIYPINTIKDDENGIMGSCATYDTRLNVTSEVRGNCAEMDLNAVCERWGERFVVVASQQLRNNALFGCGEIDPDATSFVTDVKYAVLERIGRSRYHGEVTQCEDGLKVFNIKAKAFFYIRKILRQVGLITLQSFSARSKPKGCAGSVGTLVHLRRFYVEHCPLYVTWLEDLTSRLSSKPGQREILTVIRSEMGLKEITFKKLYLLGSKYVKRELLKYRDVHPNAASEEYLTQSNSVERSIRMMSLIKPFTRSSAFEDNEEEETEELDRMGEGECDGKDETEEKDLIVTSGKLMNYKGDTSSFVYDRTILHQMMNCIENSGEKGRSVIEVRDHFGITRIDARFSCHILTKKGFTLTSFQDEGKIRTSRFLSKRNCVPPVTSAAEERALVSADDFRDETRLTKEVKDENFAKNISLTVDEEVSLDVTTNEELMMRRRNEDEEERHKLVKLLEIFPENAPIKTLRRANIIMNAVKHARIISNTFLIQKKIRVEEGTSMIDKKTMMRLVEKLCNGKKIQKLVKIVELTNGQEMKLNFFCDMSITENDPLMKSTFETVVQKLTSVKVETKKKCSSPVKSESEIQTDDLCPPTSVNSESEIPSYDLGACRKHGYLARMARLRKIHEFLWFMVYGFDVNSRNVAHATTCKASRLMNDDDDQAKKWSEVKSAESEYETPSLDQATQWTDVYCWQTYLHPLPEHLGYSSGWFCVADILKTFPLCTLCQILSLPFKIDGLDSYLEDHIKRFTLFFQLPLKWQSIINYKRRFITHFCDDCKLLAQLGLLSFGRRDFRQKEQGFIYIHRKGSLLDTTKSVMERSKFPIHTFTFDKFESLEEYWLMMQSHSFNTPCENLSLDFRSKSGPKDRFNECLAEKDVDEIIDDGRIPGNGMGASGIDSSFFSHLKRNWSKTAVDIKTESLISDGQYLANERAETRAKRGKKRRVKRKTDAVQENAKKLKKEEEDTEKKKKKDQKKRKNKETKPDKKLNLTDEGKPEKTFIKQTLTGVLPKKGGKGIKRRQKGVIEGLLKKSRRMKVKKTTTSEPGNEVVSDGHGRVHKRHDIKDIDAIRLMKRRRVLWTPPEDSLLLLCVMTSQFLLGQRRGFIVGFAVIRDIVHENFVVSRDKTRMACSRRMKYMMKNRKTAENVAMYLGEALQDKELVAEFKEGKRYVLTNIAYNEEAFKKCLTRMRKKFRLERETVPDLPDTLDEFHKRYNIIGNQTFSKTVHNDVASIPDIYFGVLHNLIHAVIVLTDKIGRSHELFQLFRRYPESVLESIFTSMKNDRILTKIKKGLPKKSPVGGIPVATIGTYQISQRYMYFWTSNYPHGLFQNVGSAMRCFTSDPQNDESESDFLLTEDTPNYSVLTVALTALRLIIFETTIPEHIVLIESMPGKAKTGQRAAEHVRRRMEDDLDIEEEALIEEAERYNTASSSVVMGTSSVEDAESDRDENATQSTIKYNKNKTTSRTVLSLYHHCQYVHSNSTRLISPTENLFVNACDVRFRLKPNVTPDTSEASKATWNVETEAHKEIMRWNQTHVMLHPKTCYVMLKTIRSLLPDQVNVQLALKHCSSLSRSTNTELDRQIYDAVKEHEIIGMTIYDLKSRFRNVKKCVLMDHCACMIESKVLVRVGVTVFRYVCLEFANSWLIRIEKNMKGRGILHADEITTEIENESSQRNSRTNRNSQDGDSCGNQQETSTVQDVPPATGTYRSVRLIPRPWRTPEGTVNRLTLRTMLESVLSFIMENPGTTRDLLTAKYSPVLQPVAIVELIEMLEEIGCLTRSYLNRSHRSSLFSRRSIVTVELEDSGEETEIFTTTVDCILKLGQFVTQLLSGFRSV